MTANTANPSSAAANSNDGRERVRTGLGADAIAEALIDNLHFLQAKLPQHATPTIGIWPE